MNPMTVLQRALELLPIRGKGRVAEMVLSHMTGEIDCHPLPGVTVHLRADQRIERWMWAGAYESELVSLLKRTLQPGMTVLDIGRKHRILLGNRRRTCGRQRSRACLRAHAPEYRPSAKKFGAVPLVRSLSLRSQQRDRRGTDSLQR